MSSMSTIYSRPSLESIANCYPFFSASSRQQKTVKSRKDVESRSVVSEVSSNLNCALQISQPDYSSLEDNESFDFLNVLFIAKLRNWLQQTYRKVNIIQDINSLQTKQFKAMVNKTEITVQKDGIFFVAQNEAELKKAMKDAALMIYRNYPEISLYAICADKAKQKVLQQVLDEAYLEVELEKTPTHVSFQPTAPSYSEGFNNNCMLSCEPSAPPAENAPGQQSAPLADFFLPFKSSSNTAATAA